MSTFLYRQFLCSTLLANLRLSVYLKNPARRTKKVCRSHCYTIVVVSSLTSLMQQRQTLEKRRRLRRSCFFFPLVEVITNLE